MADQVITKQELIDAQKDAQTLEDAVNGEPGKLIKSRTGREFYSLASVPQINTMTREEVTAAVTPKANKVDVDTALSTQQVAVNTALSNLSTTANKYYSTLAAANADIANIALNQSVTIGEEANSGLWEKKTADATTLTKSPYDPLTQAKNYSDSNPLFKPVMLTTEDNVDSLVNAGIYHISSDTVASVLGLPTGREGTVIVGGYVTPQSTRLFQTYISITGSVFVRRKNVGVFTKWDGMSHTRLTTSSNLNDLITPGMHHIASDAVASKSRNFPFEGSNTIGILTVKEGTPSYSTLFQQYMCCQGIATRTANITTQNGSIIANWGEWTVFNFQDSLKIGMPPYKTISTMTQLNGNLDNAIETLSAHINSGGLVLASNGFPIVGSAGFLTVKQNSQGTVVYQKWECRAGEAFRWGFLENGVASWNDWRGYQVSKDEIVDISEIAKTPVVVEPKKTLVSIGSSTLWYCGDELQELATRKNLNFINCGISGATLASAAYRQGANVVTLTFPDGVIKAGSVFVPCTMSDTFGGAFVANTYYTILSNGVTGRLDRISGSSYQFRASNLTSDLAVGDTALRVIDRDYSFLKDGIFVFNVGKNNIGTETADYIFEKTVQMSEYINDGQPFIVGGHFANTGTDAGRLAKVNEVNNRLRLKYGLKYFDINELLFSDDTWTELGLTKTVDDLTAISSGWLPPSLSRDVGHLSEAMDIILARVIENKLTSLGCI